MKRIVLILLLALPAVAQIRVDPAVVNVNSQGASTVFLSYGSIRPDQYSAEALWCADLVPAPPPAVGMMCNPATTWGRLPLRNDLARPSGQSGLTDIMTIPQNVIRRAYQRAERGAGASFYYVRRFSSSANRPDEYIAIVNRLAGRGATVPLSLTDVKIEFATKRNVLSVPVGQAPPPLHADLTYTGTGRLIGRWEVVLPGDQPPATQDLVTEASLPVELRGTQKRYTQLTRFNVFLPPTGSYRLEGPDVSKLPTAVEGLFQILLRIEASDDGEGNTDLAEVGSGNGVVSAGGVAGFALPVLRYYVGTADANGSRVERDVMLVAPQLEEVIAERRRIEFQWLSFAAAQFYRLDLIDADGKQILSAIVEAPVTKYRAPLLDGDRAASGKLSWRIVVIGLTGKEIARSSLWAFRYGATAGSN